MTVDRATPTGARPDVAIAIPANYWSNGEFKDRYDPKADHFTTLAELSPATSEPPRSGGTLT